MIGRRVRMPTGQEGIIEELSSRHRDKNHRNGLTPSVLVYWGTSPPGKPGNPGEEIRDWWNLSDLKLVPEGE